MYITDGMTVEDRPPILASLRNVMHTGAGRVPANNASVKHAGGTAVNYGEIMAGTPLAKASDGSLHPCGLAAITTVITAANIAILGSKHHGPFRLNDRIALVIDASEVKVITAGAASATLSVKALKPGLSLAIVIGGNSTPFAHAYDETTKRITITSQTDGGGAALTTLETVQEILTTVYGDLIESAVPSNGAALVIALAPTALGNVALQALATNRRITDINTGTGAMTFDGAAVTAPIGTLVVKELAYKPIGILAVNITTLDPNTQKVIPRDVVTTYYRDNDIRRDAVIGLSARLEQSLNGAPFVDVLTGAWVVPDNLVGIRLLNL